MLYLWQKEFMFSKACEYGIRATLYIASQSLKGRRVKIGDIVQNIDSPEAFTGKILGLLSKNNIIQSHTGPNGGFEISNENMHSVTLANIVEAIDGNAFFEDCALGLSKCDEKSPCPMHHSVDEIRKKMWENLKMSTVYGMAMDMKKNETLLKR